MLLRARVIYLGLFLICTAIFSPAPLWSEESNALPAPEMEPEFVIIKYGSLMVRSPEPGTRVYIDEIYKGGADDIIEGILAGDHVITCKTDSQSVSGTFRINKNETLRLEARFGEEKLVLDKEPVKPEVRRKPEPAARQEKAKKAAPEPKKVERTNPVEDRRKVHLNVMTFTYEVTQAPEIKIGHRANQQVINKFTLRKNKTGKYYRTKQDVLLCDAGPCELTWTSTFLYTDESRKQDALLVKWKETVFNGITPSGTSRRDLECCLNGQCWRMEDKTEEDTAREFSIDRYRLIWTKTSVIIRRADIMQEVLDAGRSLTDY